MAEGRIALRCDADWGVDVEADAVTHHGQCSTFTLGMDVPFRYFKPVLIHDGVPHWARGKNYLILAHGDRTQSIYPYFFDDGGCTVCDIEHLASAGSASYAFRVFTPPGYHENHLKRYPVLYLQDGQNVFFPSESFSGAHWRIPETLSLLNDMNVIDKVIAVGIYPQDRERDYTKPGYEAYGRFLANALKPQIDEAFRTLGGPQDTAVMGSSLGGVVSFYVAWQWPEIFGMTACLSSTFGWQDDLLVRVANESVRDIRIYLDSGWPQDNYEMTRDIHALLMSRGYASGRDLLYFAYPGAHHLEAAWAVRSHIPFQFMFRRSRTANRPRSPGQ